MNTPRTAPSATTPSTSSAPHEQARTGVPAHALDRLAGVLTVPVAVAQRVLPRSPVPVALGAGALLLAGIVEWPVAGALGLGYLALRGWRTRP